MRAPDRRRFLTGCAGLAVCTAGTAQTAGSRTGRRLAELRPNESVVLGEASVEGDFNATARQFGLHLTGPRRRNYCQKMVWSPRRNTAIYLGANHGKPHRLNDVWEFDLAALRWQLLYAPDLPRDYKGLGPDAKDVEFRDGILQTRRGGPAIIGHTWSGITYDPDINRVLFMNVWPADIQAAIERVGGDASERYLGPPMWSFDPQARRWQPIISPGPYPPQAFGGLLEHVPQLGGSIWHMNNWQMRQTWLYNSTSNRWQDVHANADGGDFARQAPVAELVAYLDPQRQLVVGRVGLNTHHFDIVLKRWQKVETRGAEDTAVPKGHSTRTAFVYERASGSGVMFDTVSRSLWAYRPEKSMWSSITPRGPAIPTGEYLLCYADPLHGVVVIIDDRLVWAYRMPAD